MENDFIPLKGLSYKAPGCSSEVEIVCVFRPGGPKVGSVTCGRFHLDHHPQAVQVENRLSVAYGLVEAVDKFVEILFFLP